MQSATHFVNCHSEHRNNITASEFHELEKVDL